MRVLGVDPGLTRCGLAVIDVDASRRVRLLAVEVAQTPPDAELGVRLQGIEVAILRLLDRFEPDAVAVERVFSQHNVRTVMGTAQAAGIAALAAARLGIPMHFHTPSEVKAAVTGSGRADKKQVAAMVNRIVSATVTGPADATDAVALAICHAWRVPAQMSVQRAMLAAAQSRAPVTGSPVQVPVQVPTKQQATTRERQ